MWYYSTYGVWVQWSYYETQIDFLNHIAGETLVQLSLCCKQASEIGCTTSSDSKAMGAGASIATAPRRPREHSNEVSSRTTRSVNSVRAMALKNHARQENSYIPSNRLRNFNKTARHASADDGVVISRETVTIQEEVTQSGKEPSTPVAAAPEPVAPIVGGLMQFKSTMNLNLKISLEDDNDWGKVRTGPSCSVC
jgi:hypothetical protein